MHSSVLTYPLQFMPTLDGADLYLPGETTRSFVTIWSRLASGLFPTILSSQIGQELNMSYHHCKLIASGVARLHGDLLLVQQSYPGDPRPSWGLPGGQVEPGEELLAGLQRELLEETGLTLVGTPTIAFVLQVLRETEEGIQEWLACHFACDVAGRLSPHDPDGLVLSAHWVKEQAALEYLGTDPGYDCEPLRRWLCGEAAPGTVYTVKVK